jgi:hypothetical protein
LSRSSVAARIGLFAFGLVAVFAVAMAAGSLVDPAETGDSPAHGDGEHVGEGQSPAGLAVAAAGYSLRLDPTFLRRDEAQQLRFSIAALTARRSPSSTSFTRAACT